MKIDDDKKEKDGQFHRFAGLQSFPPVEKWDDWKELDSQAWPRRVEKSYMLVPTVCFNCEAACGLTAYVDKETQQIRKLEGLPVHPASRGRNCAKGPATIGQVTNPDRILYPLKRTGPRGSGKFERVSWSEVLDVIAAQIRKAILEDRRNEVVYHVGRHGEDGYVERVLASWGVDGQNTHTNVCSSGARVGYAMWMGIDRPNPDHANAKFILLMSSHLESGHYFNPQAQRIIEAKEKGVKIAVVDTRLSNTASKADYWLSPWPGTEAGMLLVIANLILQKDGYNREFLHRWVNWQEFLEDKDYLHSLKDKGFLRNMPPGDSFGDFIQALKEIYSGYTPQWGEQETGIKQEIFGQLADHIIDAGSAFATHIWRNAASAHIGGWMVTRALMFLNVLVGAVATKGGMIPNTWTKFVPEPPSEPEQIRTWNEVHFPLEFPLTHFELSFLMPHLLKRQQKKLDVYFTRVYNPVWINPDGFSWIEALTDESVVGTHICLTPVWSETAQYADYVLPMGLGPERHDLHSYETHAAQWIGFRQPVLRVAKERMGDKVEFTYEANPGEVWEESEFWIELSWRIDPDGNLGIRKHFESPYRPGEKVTLDEYYGWIFENSVPGLPEKAAKEGMTPLEYMRRYGSFLITEDVYEQHEWKVPDSVKIDEVDEKGNAWAHKGPKKINFRPYPSPQKDEFGRVRVGVEVDGEIKQGFPTPSGKLEFFSTTLRDWHWPEYAIPIYPRNANERNEMVHITSQVHWSNINHDNLEFDLLPTFRLPTLIHTRTNGAKWLYEISHNNPVWINPDDARRIGVETGDLVKVETEIGYFVDRVWVTEGIRPGVVACSHHLGRWRLHEDSGSDRWNSALVDLRVENGQWKMKQVHGVTPFASNDPDSSRIWWKEGGVNQNLIHAVQPDPISGMHAWHQKTRVTKAGAGDNYGDIFVDTNKSYQVFERWLKLTRPAPGPNGMRRPYWLMRPLKPHPDLYKVNPEEVKQKEHVTENLQQDK